MRLYTDTHTCGTRAEKLKLKNDEEISERFEYRYQLVTFNKSGINVKLINLYEN